MSQSIPLPDRHKVASIPVRQQRSELWGVVQATKAALNYGISGPALILDATSAYGSTLKGSTGVQHWDRNQILQELHIICSKTNFRAYLNLINTLYHPADYPSRVYCSLDFAPQTVKDKLNVIELHPALITTEPEPFRPDLSRQAWATPDWMRWFILKAPLPPTVDLFADLTSALTKQHYSMKNPFHPQVLQSPEICFFQPPYNELSQHWQACLPHLPTAEGFWGLVPKNFYLEELKPSLGKHHICKWSGQVNYTHHTCKGQKANFKSTLFFIPPTDRLTTTCHCQYLHKHKPTTPPAHTKGVKSQSAAHQQ